jgi:hypothetical protein
MSSEYVPCVFVVFREQWVSGVSIVKVSILCLYGVLCDAYLVVVMSLGSSWFQGLRYY